MRRSVPSLSILSVLALGALGGAGCRTAAPARPPGAPGVEADIIKSYVGQTRLLPGRGEQKSVGVRKSDSGHLSGGCDVGVEIRKATFNKGSATFALGSLGHAQVGDKSSARKGCRGIQSQISLTVSGFSSNDGSEEVKGRIDQVLQTPEAYLKANRVPFEFPAPSGRTPVADLGPRSNSDERDQGRKVTTWSRKVLSVDPIVRDPKGKVHHEGEVEFEAVVGADGRLRDSRILTGLGEGHEQHILRTLELWRFEPARQGNKPVASRLSSRVVFRIY